MSLQIYSVDNGTIYNLCSWASVCFGALLRVILNLA